MTSPQLASFAAMILLAMAAGCDPSVEPFEENDLHYSIFGHLDASADTQFVRVELLRDGLLTRAPATLDAEVTLTHLASGRTVSLRDSLFQYSDRTSFHNFYTTADVEPTASYRLTVQGPGTAESRVQTSTPNAFPAPTVTLPVPDCFPNCGTGHSCSGFGQLSALAVVRIEGIERLVAVRALYHLETSSEVWSYSHLADTIQAEDGAIEAWVDYGRDWCNFTSTNPRPRRIEIVVAAGHPDWPDFMGMDQETKLLPGTASNVEGGVGFLGGIVTDTVVVYPYDE